MQEHTVTRDGQQDLYFKGKVLADACNKWVAGEEKTRWHLLTLYRTAGGKYVLQKVYRTLWQGELNSRSAEVYDTAEEVLRALTNKDGGLSDLDKELLELAVKSDKAFAGLWAEVLKR